MGRTASLAGRHRVFGLVLLHACMSVALCGADSLDATAPTLQSIGSLLSPIDTTSGRQVTLRGVVTLARKREMFVQDQTGALPVFTNAVTELSIGDEVELQGEVRREVSSAYLTSATVRKLWSGSAPVPVSLTPDQGAEGSFNNWLIDTEGRLLKKNVGDGLLRLTLEGNGQIFGASLTLSSPLQGSTQFAKKLEEGSLLRIVGVCTGAPNLKDSVGSAFVVLMRSTDDIRVISAAPWWNLQHAIWLGCLSLALVSFLFWLRHRALNLRFQAIVEERSRIAREMHDTLAQGFSGLTYQLEGLEQELSTSAEKTSVERHLSLALQLVRHCREEAHRSIFALRSLTQANPDLLELLDASCQNLKEAKGVRLVTSREGRTAPIPEQTLNHLLRIGQEAITNALRHSSATHISVMLKFHDGACELSIKDDGSGFDLNSPLTSSLGHFGLIGMRERAKHIDGELAIHSELGSGTTVSITTTLLGSGAEGTLQKVRGFIALRRANGRQSS